MNRRIVVKIGSQVLCDTEGELNQHILSSLVGQLCQLQAVGWEVLLISSGAVAAGLGVATERVRAISDPVARKQVLAATGQVRLMENYRELFETQGVSIAQVLASKGDFQTRRHYLNMRGCIEALLAAGIVPIVNENDVVAVTELMFTDNDELAGLLAGMVNADLLCLLSTVPGVFDGDPDAPETQLIKTWDEQRHRAEDVVSRATSALGRGGMHSKLAMARKTAALGTEVIIADGNHSDILLALTSENPPGTRFPARTGASPAKRWVASADVVQSESSTGSVTINQGAVDALLDQSRLTSLLPVGIESVDGPFDAGDVIRIKGPDGLVLGCGRARYGHEQAAENAGKRGQKALIHYDYLFTMQ